MIKINGDYAFQSDGKCVILYNREVILGYFDDFTNAAIWLVDYSVKLAGSFEAMLEKRAQIKKDIDEAYKVFKGDEN